MSRKNKGHGLKSFNNEFMSSLFSWRCLESWNQQRWILREQCAITIVRFKKATEGAYTVISYSWFKTGFYHGLWCFSNSKEMWIFTTAKQWSTLNKSATQNSCCKAFLLTNWVIDRSIDQSIDSLIHGWINGRMDGLDRWINGSMDRLIHSFIHYWWIDQMVD